MLAEEALKLLKEGNKRYIEGNSIHPHSDPKYRKSLANEQHPFAVILTCADSRVTPEILFDCGLGDLFVIRVAGNVAKEKVVGSIEYAIKYLNANLVVVMGHEKCGAVSAAMSDAEPGGHIGRILENIKPAVYITRTMKGDTLTNAIKLNAQIVSEHLKENKPIIEDAVKAGGVKIYSSYYELSSGKVEFFDA